jgi:hypothetical protein
MQKTRVHGSGIHNARKPELLYPRKTLEIAVRHDVVKQFAVESYETVYRVVDYFGFVGFHGY